MFRQSLYLLSMVLFPVAAVYSVSSSFNQLDESRDSDSTESVFHVRASEDGSSFIMYEYAEVLQPRGYKVADLVGTPPAESFPLPRRPKRCQFFNYKGPNFDVKYYTSVQRAWILDFYEKQSDYYKLTEIQPGAGMPRRLQFRLDIDDESNIDWIDSWGHGDPDTYEPWLAVKIRDWCDEHQAKYRLLPPDRPPIPGRPPTPDRP